MERKNRQLARYQGVSWLAIFCCLTGVLSDCNPQQAGVARPPEMQLQVTMAGAFVTVHYPDDKVMYVYQDNNAYRACDCQSQVLHS